MSSRPPRSRSSMFIAPTTRTPSTSSSATKPTLLSKLRRVSSFSSLSGSSRTPSPPMTPTTPSSPSIRDDYDSLPQDIPRSSSVMSWFSSDEEADSSRRPWKMPKLRRKNRLSPKSPSFTFTTSASELASDNARPSSSLAAPLYLSSGPSLLPAVYPLELDLALDFDCAFPSAYDSDGSGPPSPPFAESFSMPQQYFGSPTTMLHRPRESVCWYDDRDQAEEEDVDSQTLYAPSSSSDSPHTSLAWSTIRRASRSPDMTEDDDEVEEDDPNFGKFRADEIDPDVCRQLAAFRILPDAPTLIATPRTPSLRPSSSTESLLDPHFDSPCTPSPSSTFSSSFSHITTAEPVSPKFALNFPLPPSCPLSTQKSMSFVSFELDDDEFFDCTS
ncbi:hypothetical protein JCM5353_001927 [Sporobolomyces roseus]